MKETLKLIGLCLLIFFGISLLTFSFIFFFLNIFYNFNMLSATVVFWIALGCSVVVAIFFLWYFIVRLKAVKSTRFSCWLSQKYPKIILYYIVTNIILVSIKTEILWSYESLKDIISLEWTIFGISITIFLVWSVVILQYLEKAKPKRPKKMNSIQKREFIANKELFYPQASATFNSITLLIINLLVLVLATALVFLIKEEVTLFCQDVVIVSFYLCTNSIISLLMDIVLPLIEQKRAMLKETKIMASEVKEKEEIEEGLLNTYRLLKNIDQLESVDDEQKLKMKAEIALKFLGSENHFGNNDGHNNSESA